MEPHSAQTYPQVAQHIPKSGKRKKENKREYPFSNQISPERQTRQPSRGTDFKPWVETRRPSRGTSFKPRMETRQPSHGTDFKPRMETRQPSHGTDLKPRMETRHPSHGTDFKPRVETRHHPHSLLASQSPYRPNRPSNLAFTSLLDDEPPSPPTHNPHPCTGTMPRKDGPHSRVSSDFLLARVRIMNKRKPQPDDDDLLYNLAKVHDPYKDGKNACDEQMNGRIEAWLDGVEEFVPLKRAPPKDFRSWLRTKGMDHQLIPSLRI